MAANQGAEPDFRCFNVDEGKGAAERIVWVARSVGLVCDFLFAAASVSGLRKRMKAWRGWI